MQKQPSEGFFKKRVMRNFVEFPENICNGISFWCFKFCEICKSTFSAEHLLMTASDYSSINSNKGVLADQTVNYETRTKAKHMY